MLEEVRYSEHTFGYRVAETETHEFHVVRMAFNWRIGKMRKPVERLSWLEPNSQYCYVGTGLATLARAILAAQVWAATGAAEPEGWNKHVVTGRWRETEEWEGEANEQA